MSGRVDPSGLAGDYQPQYPYWAMTEPGVVVRVEEDGVAALLVYGDISSERLRSIRTRRLDLIDDSFTFPQWDQDEPPTETQLREAAAEPVQIWIDEANDGNFELKTYSVDDIDQLIRRFGSQREGDTVEDYYLRFSAVVRAITPHVDSPNLRIADALGLSPNVVKQYVSRCRRYGFLPPTRRSSS